MNLAKVDMLLAKHDAVLAPPAASKADARLDAALEKARRLHEGGQLTSLEGAPTGYDAALEKAKRFDDAFEESKHPRDEGGKFTEGGGVGGGPLEDSSKRKEMSVAISKQVSFKANAAGKVTVVRGGPFVPVKLTSGPYFFTTDPNLAMDYSDDGRQPIVTYSYKKSALFKVGSPEWNRKFGEKYEDFGPDLFTDTPKEVIDYIKSKGLAGISGEDGGYIRIENPKAAGLKAEKHLNKS